MLYKIIVLCIYILALTGYGTYWYHVLYEKIALVSLICQSLDFFSLKTEEGWAHFILGVTGSWYSKAFLKLTALWIVELCTFTVSQHAEVTLFMTYKRCHQGVYYNKVCGLDQPT